MRVFVVDDDRDLAEGLAEVLRLAGHQVEVAFSGEEAVRIFREKDFDVSFMDVVMPGMNGVESFLAIRKIKPDAKVYMVTGYSVRQLLDQAIAHGALGILEKPVGIEEVLARVDEAKPEGMVLLADDDPDFRAGIEAILKQRGYTVRVVTTGQQALDAALAGGIDVLALDLRMPALSGVEVYLELRKQGRTLPTIIMSAFVTEEAQALRALDDTAVTGILTKPFDPVHLIAALERIAREKSAAANSMDRWFGTAIGPSSDGAV